MAITLSTRPLSALFVLKDSIALFLVKFLNLQCLVRELNSLQLVLLLAKTCLLDLFPDKVDSLSVLVARSVMVLFKQNQEFVDLVKNAMVGAMKQRALRANGL